MHDYLGNNLRIIIIVVDKKKIKIAKMPEKFL